MNNPPYIVVDEVALVVADIAAAMAIDINYQYGYVHELNETLMQWAKSPTLEPLKFPLIWLEQPFTIVRGKMGWFGEISNIRLFLIQQTNALRKASDRMQNVFKPTLYPMYRQLLISMKRSKAFSIGEIDILRHSVTDRYYWGKNQQSVLNDKVDCMEISDFYLRVNNNQNC
jgi:hypothetical protein